MQPDLDKHFKVKRNKHVSKDGMVITKQFKHAMWRTRFIQAFFLIVLLSIAGLLAYVSFSGPIKTPDGYITPKTVNVKIGDSIIATNNKDGIGSRFREATVGPETIVYGEIIAGPYGVLSGKDGSYKVDDGHKIYDTNITLKSHNLELNKEYIVRCSAGNCEKGKDYLFKEKKVKGVLDSAVTK